MSAVHRAGAILIVIAALWPAAKVVAQRTRSASLVIDIVPEAEVKPSHLSAQFAVSADGRADNLSQSTVVTARVRALPNRQIRLDVRIGAVTGPSGPAPSAIVEWSGARLGATGGAQSATCTSGSFAAGPSQALIADWPSSGTISCRIALTLANPRVLMPGFYNASFDLELRYE